tara:strand:+ start:194 stop:1150 length:957 start_codon:yes stop_codon:yes gene_type:complete
MSFSYSRPLADIDNSYHFLNNVLNLDDGWLASASSKFKDIASLAMDIMATEKMIVLMEQDSTIASERYRVPNFKNDTQRRELRTRIFEELIGLERLDDDDSIALGVGGAKPRNGVRSEKKAFLVTGLPASGKSSIVSKIADRYGAYVIDSDFSKRKLPEFNINFGANLVHQESQLVTLGSKNAAHDNEYNLYEYCISKDHNIIIPKIGYDHKSIEKMRDTLIDKYGYEVHLTLVSLDRVKSTLRALGRYLTTDRYVPLTLIFDGYANDPILSYYRTKDCDKWASYGKISSDVGLGELPKFVEGKKHNPSMLFKTGEKS